MIRAYDDNGNVVDLVEWEQQIRAEVIDEFVNKCEKRIEEIVLKIEDDLPFLDIFDIQKIAEQLKEQNSIIDSLKPKCSNEMPKDIVCNCTKESNK